MFGPLAGKLSPLGGSRRNSHEVTARPHPASDDAAAIDELAMALFKVAQTGGKLSKSSRKKAQAQAAKQVKQLAHGDDAPPPTTSQPVNNTSTTSHETTEVAEHPSSTSTSDSQDSVEATPRPRPAPLGPASAPMDLSSTLVTLAEADETTKDTVISNHDVALHLKRILRQAELNGAGETSGCPTVDEDLVPVFSCLSRPSVMNGAEVLDAFNCSHPHSVWKELEDGTPKTKQQSIMVSCDLSGLGTKSHKVVLAEYHHRDPHTGKTIPKHRRSHSRSSSLSRTLGWKNHWLPFGKPKPGQQVDQDDEKPIVWHPSLTQLSIHAAWWGYSIYLPASVMKELDVDQEDVLKRIAAISTAIGFILKALPTLVTLTPPMLVAIGLLQGLAPIVGFIAQSISWSWEQIKSYDKGQGVILSATWALPVALIPRSWDAESPPLSDKARQRITTAEGQEQMDILRASLSRQAQETA